MTVGDDRRMAGPQHEINPHRPDESQPDGSPQPDSPRIRSATLRRISAICAALLAVVYLLYILSIPFGLVGRDNRLGTPEIVLAVVLLSALAFAAQDCYTIIDFTFGTSGVSAKFGQRVKTLENEVRALQVAVAGLVTKHEWEHLTALEREGQPALVYWRKDRSLLSELYRLDALRFVETLDNRGIEAIRQDQENNPDQFDLKHYLKLTEEGREYLALRKAYAPKEVQDPAD